MERIIFLEKREIRDLSDILRLAHAIGKKVLKVDWVNVSPTVFPVKDKTNKIVAYTVKVSPDIKRSVERGRDQKKS